MSTKKVLIDLLQDEAGQDLIEYAILGGIVGIGAVISLSNLTTKVKTAFNSVGSSLTSAV